ncbi:MAG: molybdate ABC transporter substrate-binding protein [Blastocatellia bacterium]|nr:MAG: molybdate ABC transporter substrate-binding protein [Blastocatellia bacterium]
MRYSLLGSSLLTLVLSLMPPIHADQSAAPDHTLAVISSTGLKAVLDELLPEFEHTTGYKVAVKYGPSAALKQQIEQGAPFDLVVLTPAFIEDLIRQGSVVPDSKHSIARAGMAIAVRAGAQRPDIRTTNALTRTLLEAKSIAYAKQGAGGIYFAALTDRLKIAERLTSKSRPTETGDQVAHAVAAGEAELGILPLSEILPVPQIEVLGPFPPEVQDYAVMVGGVGAHATDAAAAKKLIAFLTAPGAVAVIERKGMELVK